MNGFYYPQRRGKALCVDCVRAKTDNSKVFNLIAIMLVIIAVLVCA